MGPKSDEEVLLQGLLSVLNSIGGAENRSASPYRDADISGIHDLRGRVFASEAEMFDATLPSASISNVDISQEGILRELSVTVTGLVQSSFGDRGLWDALSLLDDLCITLSHWDLSEIILSSGATASLSIGSGSVSETDIEGSTVRSVEQSVTFSYPSHRAGSNCI